MKTVLNNAAIISHIEWCNYRKKIPAFKQQKQARLQVPTEMMDYSNFFYNATKYKNRKFYLLKTKRLIF